MDSADSRTWRFPEELGLTEGIAFSSGRLGHMWGHVNGVALAERGGTLCVVVAGWSGLGKNSFLNLRVIDEWDRGHDQGD